MGTVLDARTDGYRVGWLAACGYFGSDVCGRFESHALAWWCNTAKQAGIPEPTPLTRKLRSPARSFQPSVRACVAGDAMSYGGGGAELKDSRHNETYAPAGVPAQAQLAS